MTGPAVARTIGSMATHAQSSTQLVYDFTDGSREMRPLLGGKGSGIAEMTRVLGPDLVPAGFTITTEACGGYMTAGRRPPDGLAAEVDEALGRLEELARRPRPMPRHTTLAAAGRGHRDQPQAAAESRRRRGRRPDRRSEDPRRDDARPHLPADHHPRRDRPPRGGR